MAARVNSYDYDDIDGNKRHVLDDRRKWRKKALLNPMENHRDWDRRRNEYENPRYMEEPDPKIFGGIDRQRDNNNNMDVQSSYRQPQRNYEEDKINLQQTLNQEVPHASSYM